MLNPIAVYAFVAASTVHGATDTPALATGLPVRVSLSGGSGQPRTLRRTIVAFDRDTLTLASEGEATAVVLRSDKVTRLDRLVKRSNRKKGAVIGASLLGGAMLALLGSYCLSDWGCEGGDSRRVVAVIAGSAALGALLGVAGSHGDLWKEMPLDNH